MCGIGAREKYRACPRVSLTTFTTFGSPWSADHGSRNTPSTCHRRIGNQRFDDLLDHLRLDERFVALDVHHDVARQVGSHFRDAIGAGAVRGACHSRDPAKAVTAAATRSSSVATTTASTPRAAAARR
jgi:hypothetical protein